MNNLRHGQGSYKYASTAHAGTSFSGTWVNGKADGKMISSSDRENTFSVLALSSMVSTYRSSRMSRVSKTQRTLRPRKWSRSGEHTKSHHSPLTLHKLLNNACRSFILILLEIYGYVSRCYIF